jgi:hypothetical protein
MIFNYLVSQQAVKIFDLMKSAPFLLSIIFIISCKEKHSASTSHELNTKPKDSIFFSKDSIPGPKDSIASRANPEKTIYIERARLELKNYSIAIKSKFILPDELKEDSSFYFEQNFLFVYNKTSKRTDSVHLDMDYYSPYRLAIEDLSDSLRFKNLLLQLSWIGDSDMDMYEFIECGNHSLKNLFSVTDLVTLKRKDEWTLSGFVSGRDELVYSGESDYPVTISLKNNEVKITDPAIQYIGYTSKALKDIRVYRDQAQNKTSAYTIKKGTGIIIDTLYRSRNLVRLIVSDSIILYARPDKIKDKIQQNTAG